MADPGKLIEQPFVIAGPNGVAHLGLYASEQDAWTVYLGWPSEDEIAEVKAKGYFCVPATVTYQRP